MIKNLKILIVDDEPRLCDSLETLLCAQNYDVKTCNSGNEALPFLTSTEFDLVLLDIFMEGMDGFQVFEETMNQKIDTPVIIMTGNASTDSAVKALRMGAYDYLKKPFEPEELFASVKNALNQRRLKKENEHLTKKLRENEKKYRTLFDSSFDAISIIDCDTGKFIDCNSATLKLHETDDREKIIGLTPDQFSPEFQSKGEPSRKLLAQYIQTVFKEGKKELEWNLCKRDGTIFPVMVTLSPIVLGEKRLVMAIVKDITRRKKAEEGREKVIKILQKSFMNVKTLSGLVPICAHCKKVRDDKGSWNQIEAYVQKNSYASFSHSTCPECMDKIYGKEDWYIEMKKEEKE